MVAAVPACGGWPFFDRMTFNAGHYAYLNSKMAGISIRLGFGLALAFCDRIKHGSENGNGRANSSQRANGVVKDEDRSDDDDNSLDRLFKRKTKKM